MTRRRSLVATCVAAVVSALLALPAAASANAVDDLLNGVSNTVHGLTGGGSGGGTGTAQADPAQPKGSSSSYVPPLHGTNPHGQGTVAIGDIDQSSDRPFPYDPNGGDEELVVGQSRGEQNPDGSYHGHITIASTFITGELLGVDTNEGQHSNGPLGPINDVTCPANGGGFTFLDACVLAANSNTTENGSSNFFETVGLGAGIPGFIGIVDADVASSNGDISEGPNCQTSHGDSQLADVSAVEIPGAATSGRQPKQGGGAVEATALNSSTDSQACRGSAPTQQNQSGGVEINGFGLDFPSADCENGVPNTQALSVLFLDIICNADDTNGSQDTIPYGVREALDIAILPFTVLLDGTGTELLGTDGGIFFIVGIIAAAESHAVAPAAPPPPPPPPPPCANPPCHNRHHQHQEHEKQGGPGLRFLHRVAAAPRAELPFTGADLLTLALIGFGVMGTGLGAMALSDRMRRAA